MAKREERHIIGIVGRTNAGKSSLLNALSGQENYAITDSTPGTTADTVTTIMEIHGLGPCKILDTAGVDEDSALGEKKRKKTYEALEEADLVLVVINTERAQQEGIKVEQKLIHHAKEQGKQVLLVWNQFNTDHEEFRHAQEKECDALGISLRANDISEQHRIASFLQEYFDAPNRDIDLLPGISEKGMVLLIIPMDEETPSLRLLRPQDMAVERLLRNFITPVLFRLHLGKARSSDSHLVEEEKKRFSDLLKFLQNSPEGLQLVITDSQAFDIVAKWVPQDVPLTSFSVMMVHYMACGEMDFLLKSVEAMDHLNDGDTILVAESCNHNRKCDDIGTVQIPRIIKEKTGKDVRFEFAFGRTFPEDLSAYAMVIHCGSCMTDRQKFFRRIRIAEKQNVPLTNYGFFLAYAQNPETLERVTKFFFR